METPLKAHDWQLREEVNMCVDLANKVYDRLYELEKRVYRLEHPEGNIIKEASDAR